MVGVRRFELPASWSRTKRSTKLSHTPLLILSIVKAPTDYYQPEHVTGLSSGIWTHGLYHPKVARYHLRYTQFLMLDL